MRYRGYGESVEKRLSTGTERLNYILAQMGIGCVEGSAQVNEDGSVTVFSEAHMTVDAAMDTLAKHVQCAEGAGLYVLEAEAVEEAIPEGPVIWAAVMTVTDTAPGAVVLDEVVVTPEKKSSVWKPLLITGAAVGVVGLAVWGLTR